MPAAELLVEETKVGSLERAIKTLIALVVVSTNEISFKISWPVFSKVIVKVIISPGVFPPLASVSLKLYVFTASIEGGIPVYTLVGSFVVLPSVSSPSSLTSVDTSWVPNPVDVFTNS